MNIGIEIPEEYVTQKGAVLASTGNGKSYGIGSMMEEFAQRDIPFIVLDVMGCHIGIPETYKKVVLLGGVNGLELDLTNPRYYAQKIVKDNVSVVFDLSQYDDHTMQEFVAQFLDELFMLHGQRRTPRHIFVEEAEVFFPQTNYESSRESLLVGNRIMKRGRAYGLGMTLISQRPQDINKKTLSQSQCTFFLHLEGLQELEVINKMLKSEDKNVRKDIITKITRFQKGECLVYSPAWLQETKMFKFRERISKHYGDTPQLNKEIEKPKPIESHATWTPALEKKEVIPSQKEYLTNKILTPIVIIATILIAISFGWF